MADRARFEAFNDRRLIPPGINDARSQAVLAAFAHGAALLDFQKLLMRRGDEIPDEALPLAIHERSLGEYIPDYGLPANVVRQLVDRSFDIHARQGTEGGVHFGIELLGMRLELTRWYEMDPPGPHDTYEATVFFTDDFYQSGEALSTRMSGVASTMVDATKRWSQEGMTRLAIANRTTGRLGAYTHFRESFRTMPLALGDQTRRSTVRAGAFSHLTERYVTRAKLEAA